VVDLLLISDMPRLRQLFMRLADDHNLRLRVVSTLEEGGEEIATDKPAMVFVQTHVSGFSAEILLMHLKKRLGRRRTRFVLLASADQVNDSVLKLYHGHLDTSLTDLRLLDAFRGAIATLAARGKKRVAVADGSAEVAPVADAVPQAPAEPALQEPVTVDRVDFQISPSAFSPQYAETVATSLPKPVEPAPAEQGETARSRLLVYSEFSSSLESAVSDIRPTEQPWAPLAEPPSARDGRQGEAAGGDEAEPPRSKRATFLLWGVALVAVVVVVTLLQQSGSGPKTIDIAPAPQAQPGGASKAPAGGGRRPETETAGRGGDRAMLPATAGNRDAKWQIPSPPAAARLTVLPTFIPRDGLDKGYGAANPGWERYMGLVTEFKVFREGTSIKAIQVIDKGGHGIPENFMKSALAQLAGTSSFVPASSEKRDGYEIQRGQVAANLKAVFYRDAKGGMLRAFVVTWQ
jgi:hypothetical protein